MSVKSKMTALASAIRQKAGKTGALTIDGMISAVNSITVGSGGGGVTLPTLNNPGSAEDLIVGKELIDATGTKVDGTLGIVMPGTDGLIAPTSAAVKYTSSTNGRNYLRAVFQAPSRFALEASSILNVDVPFTRLSNVSLEPNLLPENIKKGVSIFDVSGSYEGSGSGSGGGTIKEKSGTFTTGTYGAVNVNCGFTPDAFTIYVSNIYTNREVNLSFVNHHFNSGTKYLVNRAYVGNDTIDCLAEFITDGVSLSLVAFGTDSNANDYANGREFKYYAVKYT